ncbi:MULTISPECIES: diguanylate cyclase [unclassified Leptolyngbya]|uniref:diguanylate cyclase n=1 Tax=unclassified Leptolyngbya TaxID=2650499 RepID=UPI0016839ADB|nr:MULTISPECIES: diguanylate cyclase [unclassified Leptolyngbya]MBD1912799.1 GGDEF domain-containing protein [Leptolyngbya sp. FACHB-8]MBD2157746.1 GGDEF domain-containing protein [Leptolyngbya sp. FACHB-16]
MIEPHSNDTSDAQPVDARITNLERELARLQQVNQDLQISLTTTAEHGDLIESQLHEANRQLKAEITERRRAESTLSTLLHLISRQKEDLEIILQTITEHGDVLDMQWYEKLRYANLLASYDGLTQVPNRRRLDEYLEQQWRQMAREMAPLSAILCDIDFFKEYNDTYGHLAGDDCLRQIAQALAQILKRPTDLLARYGGEEFVGLLPKTDLRGAIAVACQMQTAVEALRIPHVQSRVSPYVTLSIGISSVLPNMSCSSQGLLDEADHHLYQAKQQGRARIIYRGILSHGSMLSSPQLEEY